MKPRKIKRRPTYRRRNPYRRRSPIWKTLGAVVACVGIVALGVLAGKWLLNRPQTTPDVSTPSSTTSTDSTASTTTTTQTTVTPAPQKSLSGLRAVYLPPSALGDTAAFEQTVTAAKAAGYNGVVLELKDTVGRVYFQAESDTVKKAGSVHATAVSKAQLKALLAVCEEQDMLAVGYLYAFYDRTYRSMDAIIEYYAEGTMTDWLDNAYDKGGKTWLNPYKPGARQYLVGLGKELQEVGFTALIYDGVQFPFQRQLAFFDSSLTNQQKPEIAALQTFVSEAKTALTGMELSFCCAGESATGSNTAIYGSDNPLKFGGDFLSPMLPQSGTQAMLDKIRFRADELGESAPALLPWLNVNGQNANQIKAMLKAVGDGPVVVYAANGSYDFAALKG